MAVIDRGPIIDRRAHLPNRKSKKFVSLLLVVVIAMSLMAMTASLQPQESDDVPSEPPTPARIAYTTHAPILIDGDAGFLGDNSSTGISWGIGTADDPYVIEGWDIQGSTGTSCIAIQSTSAHFVIRDCYLHDCGVGSGGSGVSLLLCSNGTIDRCTSLNNDEGIEMGGCTGMIIQDSYCSMNSKGVNLIYCYHNTITNNTLADGNGYGLYFENSWDNICLRSNLSFNSQYGMLASGSDNNTFEDNVFGFNDGPGIRFESSDNNTLVENNCLNNDHGMYLSSSSDNTLSNNNCSSNSNQGIILDSSSNDNTLSDNNCSSNNDDGIYLFSSSNNTLSNNNCSSNGYYGIYLESSSNNTLSNNYCSSNNYQGIILDSSSNDNTLSDNNCSNNGRGIYLFSSSNNTLNNNNCSNNDYGIYLSSSRYNTLSDNICSSDYYDGIYLYSSSNNTLSNNTCSNNDYGMWLESSSNNTLTNNTCSSNYYDGILIYVSSNNNFLSNNTCSNSYAGIDLYSSHNNTLINNKCVNNEEGIFFEDSNSNNLIDNNCSFNNDIGIYLSTSNDNNSLSNNICSNNQYGIELVSSMGNKLCNNTCISNDETAIDLRYSDSNTLGDNNCSSSRNNGIFLVESSNNSITRNQLYYNGALGVWIMNGECSDNMIWNNTLVDNNDASSTYDPSHIQAYDDGTANWWNSTDAYGNYWSDWNSPDNDMDGIVDAPYEIAGSAGAKDWYPLTERPDIAEEPPVADAGPDQTVDEDTVVTLDGSESYDAIAVMNWTWTFTDSVLRTLYGEVVEWTFTHPGVYTVTLVVRDTIGQESAPDTCVITVRDVTPPVANAGADVTLFMSVGTQITFNGSASSDNVDVVSYTWTFVDVIPRTLTGVTPTYTFAGPGVYTVTLTVADAAGNSTTDTVVVAVLDDVDPVADAGPDQNTMVGATVTFDGSGSSDDVGIVNYTWTFTDGTEKTLYEVGQTYAFETPGMYPVTLNVSDAAGNYATDTVIITVLDVNEPPTADAGVNQTVSVGVVVKLNGSSSTDDSGSIENYTWTFVYDNESRELYGVAPIFTFNITGTYVVTLTVEDAEGETDTDTVIITVEEEEGEEQEEEKSFIESYGLAIGIVIALAVVALALLFILKGRKGGMAPTSMEEVPAGEPEAHT